MKKKNYDLKIVLSDETEIKFYNLEMELVFAILNIPQVNNCKVELWVINEVN